MGRKVNPIGFRLAVRRDWRSRWYARGREFSELVIQDAKVRKHIKDAYPQASISLVEIERTRNYMQVVVRSARPGVVIGKKGEGIDALRLRIAAITGVRDVRLDIKEVPQPDADAKLIALNIASQLERRIMFRRAMRRAMAGAMRLGVEGVKIMCAGRLNGIEIARTEWYREGRVPLHTLKNDVDYGVAEAKTNMGVVGIKVWISRGETGTRKASRAPAATEESAEIVEPVTQPGKEVGAESDVDHTDTPVSPAASAPVSQPEAQPAESTESKQSTEPEVKPAAKTKTETKPKSATKTTAKAAKPAAKKPAKKAAKPAAKKAAAKPAAAKPAAKRKPAKKAAKKKKEDGDVAAG